MKVPYQGERGAFSERAVGTTFPQAESLPCETVRLVFQEPLVYDRESGFETPTFSPPVAVSCVLELDKLELVDMVRKSWNSLEVLVREWAELLNTRQKAA